MHVVEEQVSRLYGIGTLGFVGKSIINENRIIL